MNAKEIEKNSPFLLNKDKWKRIKELQNKENSCNCCNNDALTFHAIHLYYKSINKVEYCLLNSNAKDCCYSIGDSLYEFDGYYVFVGNIDKIDIDDYWKEKLNDPSISETIKVSEKYFEDDYFEKYTRQLKKLDITYVINYRKLERSSSCIGVPVVSTFKEIIEDTFGISDDSLISFHINKLKSLYDDPLWLIPSFTATEIGICLQDIIFHDCKMHDNEEYHYDYVCHGIKIHSVLTIVSDVICIVRFFSDYIEDEDHYMYLNHKIDSSIKKIYDNSEYWTTKIEEDFI